jgi:hypothetical protein
MYLVDTNILDFDDAYQYVAAELSNAVIVCLFDEVCTMPS